MPAKNESCDKCRKTGHFAKVCRSKKKNVNTLQEMVYPREDFSSNEEGSDSNVQLLHIASLEMNGFRDKQKTYENGEWWEVVELKQGAPIAQIKQTKKTLVSYSQHRITPKGYATLPIRFKDRELHVNFFVIDSKQKPILSGKVCQEVNLVQRVHNLQTHLDTKLKELLDQYPNLQSASGAMPGTYSIKIDPKATPVVHGPRRQPAALLPKIIAKLKEMEKQGHLAKVSQPTDWVNSIIVSNGGRYRWLKLPFGIKSAPELHQRAMDEMLEDIDHAYAIMDDILIAGHDIAHHDSVLEAVLNRARTYNLKLNFAKVRVRKQQAMMLKVSGYDVKVKYLSDKKQVLADTRSRTSLNEAPPEEEGIQVNRLERISISESKYAELQQNIANELHELYAMIQAGWPETKQQVPHNIRQNWDTRDELVVLDGVTYQGIDCSHYSSLWDAGYEQHYQ
ncbi:Retrovirus-related Pol polyprotein [Stylophora pistillata]|uniref:Retrovirus-related Pol polyprotein n=1 Tax=Stylophora pistillata TaxID=50429 RepID=A0A2B4SPE1_STYPI|nr:Retrovirus-related Pol polyprotein [Stylophora pistillata]